MLLVLDKGLDSVSIGVKSQTPFAATVTFPLPLAHVLQQARGEAAAKSCMPLALAVLFSQC